MNVECVKKFSYFENEIENLKNSLKEEKKYTKKFQVDTLSKIDSLEKEMRTMNVSNASFSIRLKELSYDLQIIRETLKTISSVSYTNEQARLSDKAAIDKNSAEIKAFNKHLKDRVAMILITLVATCVGVFASLGGLTLLFLKITKEIIGK
jgi:hypothetical protein